MAKVFIITKLRTTNIGNQALSHEIIKLFANKVGDENLIVAGRPIGLSCYNFEKIMQAENPVPLFEDWADKVVAKYKSDNPQPKFKSELKSVALTISGDGSLKYESIKKVFRPLKHSISRMFVYDAAYKNRLDKIYGADLLVYSGAGEVGDNNVFLRQLLEIRVAQKLGKRTAAVNQSVVINTDVFKKLVNHVYGKMEKIVVRGEVSRDLLINIGIDPSIFIIAPDTAVLTSIANKATVKKPVVGINFTPHMKFDITRIAPVLELLKKYNNEVVFITNEPHGDELIGEQLASAYGIKKIAIVKDYKEYASILNTMKYIISTRLHSSIIALGVDTPTIPIEGNVFKTTELLAQLNYPINVIDANKDGWEEQLQNTIVKMESGAYDFDKYFADTLPAHKKNVSSNVAWL